MVTRRQFLRAGFENNKLTKRLYREVGRAIGDFRLIEENDKVMVCVSGGKDSFALLDILVVLQSRAPIHFDIVAVNLDQQLPGFPTDILPAYLEKKQVPYHIEVQDTYSIIQRLIPEGKAVCSLCSRLRRGILYKVASELGCAGNLFPEPVFRFETEKHAAQAEIERRQTYRHTSTDQRKRN